jgi:predicted lipoprotein with Yx(FWY)xxD motif
MKTSLFSLLLCSTLLITACGGGSGKSKGNPPATNYSSAAYSSTVTTSAAPSSTPASSAGASSSAAATVAPVVLIDQAVNSLDGEYFVATGDVSVGLPTDGTNTAFAAQTLAKTNFSLYFFATDVAGSGASSCNSNNCLSAWPPLLAADTDNAAAPFSIINRTMGSAGGNARQWAYQGKPLYFFSGDTAAGQTAGKAIPNWSLARPIPVQTLASASLGTYLGAADTTKVTTGSGSDEPIGAALKQGFTLYTFDNDTAGVSNCAAACLNAWPALIAHTGAVATPPYSLITRAGSGRLQWALNGMPLYFFSGDNAAGETNGEGVGGNWFVARYAPVAVSNHPTQNKLFVAHGNLINSSGAADNSRQDFTLYTFDSDTVGGPSTCGSDGGCITIWPGLYAPADAKDFGDFTVIARTDTTNGVKQWAYKGKPLYFFSGDTAVGNTNGNYPTWQIARP